MKAAAFAAAVLAAMVTEPARAQEARGHEVRPGGAGYQRPPPGGLPAWSAAPGAPDAGGGPGRDVGSAAPPYVAVPGFKVHVFLDEELPPDALRALARRPCTAWVRTRTNMIRESVALRLASFGAAYVQLRSPLLEAHGGQLRRVPGVGAWLSPRDLRARGLHVLSGRPWAVSLFGELRPEDLAAASAAKVAELRWTPGARDLTLEAWARFAQAPGQRVVVWPAGAPLTCDGWSRARAAAPPAIKIGPLGADALVAAVSACPLATRVEVPATVSDATLVRLFALSPRVELEVDVGANQALARAAAQLLDRLQGSTPGEERDEP